MIVDGRSHASAASESSYDWRRDGLKGGGEIIEPSVNNTSTEPKKSKSFRRKRMDLRRIRSFSLEKSDPTVFEAVLKKKRSDFGKEPKSVKNMAVVEGNDVGSSGGVMHGKVSVIGRRREMEDAVAVDLGFLQRGGKSYDFYGVYDGHGGWRVAQACGDMLHKLVVDVVGGESGEEIDWKKLMLDVFDRMDKEVNKHGEAVATVGSTAVVAVVGEDEVVVANCGDSRAVLSRGGCALQVSDDHKPDRPDELKRIEVSGGKVINWNGQRILGVLATSRSIGDQYLKPFVITEPEVMVINRSDTDEFLILASDGLWDVVSNELACQVARRCLDGHMKTSSHFSKTQGNTNGDPNQPNGTSSPVDQAAAVLAELAMARGSRDNISVIVVQLQR